ncbi:hypothetical protein [Flavobacterium ammonificans]|jgi:hypothetical protein|uniref:hypothetical protein n=1 Tax=Flavobacterium ammonificans TaxID=1751056 RepID=UPI001E29F64D|nr:hypothetical protein [Flavobacterium ammonificans]BDB56378.1 hypothetical protein SHINM13_06740 [Flavobacterium ammonificans]
MKNKIKHIIVAMALTLGLSYTATAQTTAQKIGKNPTNIASSAVLDIESDNKGVLFPRVALTSTILAGPIVSPTTGLTVFNTVTDGTAPNTVTPGYYYWNGSRWVKLAVETPPIAFSKTVYVNTALPSTATIFDEANPPLSNDNALKSKDDNLYIGNDGSTWTYDNTGAGSYKTYAVAASTPFNLAYTETNAGNNTTGSIWRAGNIGIGINNPLTTLHLNNPLAATNTVNANAQVFRMQRTQSPGIKWENIAQFNLGSYASTTAPNTSATSRLDLAMNDGMGVQTNNIMTWQANGNVGIGTTAPSRFLDVVNNSNSHNGIIEAEGPVSNTYTRAMAIRMRRGPSTAPTAIQTNDVSAFGFAGYDGSIFSTTSAGMAGIATENWTSSAKGMGLVFSTTNNATSTLSERMRINHNGFVGIGTNTPISLLSNTSSNINASNNMGVSTQSLTWQHSGPGFVHALYNPDITGHGLNVKVRGNLPSTIAFEVGQANTVNTSSSPLFNVLGNGNVGIGTSTPTSRLEVNGAATNTTAFNAGAGTTIDFSRSNLAYTTASPGNTFTLSNLKDGGTYTLAVQGKTAGQASFTITGFTASNIKSPNNGLTAEGKETLYTFMVMGTFVYFYMTTGL